MKISVSCSNIDLIKTLIDNGVDNIIVGINDFSCRFNNTFSIDEIKKINSIKSNAELTVCINDIIFEDKIPKLTDILKELVSIGVDWIMFHDFAIPQILYENNLNVNLHYSPETLVTSYGQFDFYLENNIKRVTLATELMFPEVKKICQNKKNMEIFIKSFGLGFVMHSRWPMISNFKKYANLNEMKFNDTSYWLIKEDLRVYPNIIYEDQYGTHMMTGYNMCGIKRNLELQSYALDYVYLDSLFIENDEIIKIFNIYKQMNNLNINNEDLENAYNEISKLSTLEISESFFGKIGDILHMKKVDDNEK